MPENRMSMNVMCKLTRLRTSPIPSPSVSENVDKIWMVGSNHAINLSSPSRNLVKACAWVRKSVEMASGFWQELSCAAKGWVSRDFFVSLWYSFKAALNIEEKLSVEGPAVWLLADIGTARGNWEGGKTER